MSDQPVLPEAWTSLLESVDSDTGEVTLQHGHHTHFRWQFLVEVSLGLMLCCCLIPLAIAAGQSFTGAEEILSSHGPWRYERFVRLAVGEQEAEWRFADADPDRGVAAVLARARAHGLDVRQCLADGSERMWLVAHPLWSPPGDAAAATSVLEELGATIERRDGVAVTWEEPTSRVTAWLILVLFGWALAVTPAGRRKMLDLIATARGEDPPLRTLHLTDSELSGRLHRAGQVSDEQRVALSDLITLTCRPALTPRGNPLGPPRITALTRQGEVALGIGAHPRLEAAAVELLFAELSKH